MRYIRFKFRHIAFSLTLLLSIQLFPQTPIYTDVAETMGINYSYNESFWGAGVSFCDFNNDGLDDLSFTSQTGEANYIFQNLGVAFGEIANTIGITDSLQSKTILWADYDNDGDKDLFIGNRGSRDFLYQNNNGSLRDVTVTANISLSPTPTMAASWADYDNDGYIDLFVTAYNLGTSNVLYRNRGDGTFEDVTTISQTADPTRMPLAVCFFDFNNDGWQDIYIASDESIGNTLLKNKQNGSFENISTTSNTNLTFLAMGIAIGDYDNDLDLDIYVSNAPAGNGLLQNNGDDTFTEIATQAGVSVNRVCWGTNFLDVDNNGSLDLFVSVSEGNPDRYNRLFINNDDGTFTAETNSGMVTDSSKSYGNAVGDFNNDGYPDIATLDILPTPASLWENKGGINNWIKVNLEGIYANRDGIGSSVKIYTNDLILLRNQACGASYLSQNSSTLTVGVGSATIVDSVVIQWAGPEFTKDVVTQLSVNQTYLIRENEGVATDISIQPNLVSKYMLAQNYPNPFNPSTTIEYVLPQKNKVQLSIYNILGQHIQTLVNKQQSAGTHQVKWNSKDHFGNLVPSGIYFYRIETKKERISQKMVLLR